MNPSRKQNAFSRLDLFLIVAALAGIILVILPQMARSRARSSRIGCTNSLKQVGLAFRIWAGDNEDKFPMQVAITNGGAMELAEQGSAYAVFLVMSNELTTPKILICPEESNPNRVAAPAFAGSAPRGTIPFTATNNLSYFVGLEAIATAPNTILAGDDHFAVGGVNPNPGLLLLPTNAPIEWRNERHPKQGNVGLADGSVMGLSTHAYRRALAETGVATNRLAMP